MFFNYINNLWQVSIIIGILALILFFLLLIYIFINTFIDIYKQRKIKNKSVKDAMKFMDNLLKENENNTIDDTNK